MAAAKLAIRSAAGSRAPNSGPNGVAWEFTAQAIMAMRFVDRLYNEHQFEQDVDFYLSETRRAQTSAPFSDGRGLVASSLQEGDTLRPIEQCLSTPFQCIPERVGLAATAWAIFAEQNFNPLSPDSDGDGWSDAAEAIIGTDPFDDCADNLADDANPPDVNNDTFYDILDIVLLAGWFGLGAPPAPVRYDIAPDPPDGFVDINDIVAIAGVFGQSCV